MKNNPSPPLSMYHIVVAVVVAIFISDLVSDEMSGQPFWLRVLARAGSAGLLVLLYFFAAKRFKQR